MSKIRNFSFIGGATAGIFAAVCCVGPFLLLTLGVTGAWIGNLTVFHPYRPYLIGLMLVFLGLAFRELYLVPRRCEEGAACASPKTLRKQRIVFWSVSVVLLGLVAFPWYAPFVL